MISVRGGGPSHKRVPGSQRYSNRIHWRIGTAPHGGDGACPKGCGRAMLKTCHAVSIVIHTKDIKIMAVPAQGEEVIPTNAQNVPVSPHHGHF